MPTLERAPRVPELDPQLITEAITDFRQARSGPLPNYLRDVRVERDTMVTDAQRTGQFELVRLIKTLWTTEEVRAAAQHELRGRGEKRFDHILSSVEWQREAAQFLLENNERSGGNVEEQERTMQPFWRAVWEIMGSDPDPAMREKMLQRMAGFRQGIMGPVATAYVVRNNLEWDAYFPQRSVDDARHGVDLLVTQGDEEGEQPDHNYLVQLKTMKTSLPYFKLGVVPPQSNDSYLQRLAEGSRRIIKRDGLDPDYTKAVIATIGTEGVGRFSGLPTAALSREVSQQFTNLDRKLYAA